MNRSDMIDAILRHEENFITPYLSDMYWYRSDLIRLDDDQLRNILQNYNKKAV